jgi:hypothetical protein
MPEGESGFSNRPRWLGKTKMLSLSINVLPTFKAALHAEAEASQASHNGKT